jgi:hypothetical protein
MTNNETFLQVEWIENMKKSYILSIKDNKSANMKLGRSSWVGN